MVKKKRDKKRGYCNEAISPVTLAPSLSFIHLLFTLIKEITTSRIAYNYTHIHIFTNCSRNCFCLLVVHLYCTILYCHPFYLSCEVQLSCMFVSFTCPSPCLYRSLAHVLVCIVHLSKSLFVSFTCPSPLCIPFLSSISSSLFHFTCSPLNLVFL